MLRFLADVKYHCCTPCLCWKCSLGFPEAGKHQGRRETHQELAALTRDAGKASAFSEQPRPLPTPIQSSQGSRAWHVGAQEGCHHPASLKGQLNWWSSLSQEELSHGIHPAESHVLCTHQNGCGNPERAPMKACSHPGLRLQGVTEPFTPNGWQ